MRPLPGPNRLQKAPKQAGFEPLFPRFPPVLADPVFGTWPRQGALSQKPPYASCFGALFSSKSSFFGFNRFASNLTVSEDPRSQIQARSQI